MLIQDVKNHEHILHHLRNLEQLVFLHYGSDFHKLLHETKTDMKNKLIDYPHPFLDHLKIIEHVHQAQENKPDVHYY